MNESCLSKCQVFLTHLLFLVCPGMVGCVMGLAFMGFGSLWGWIIGADYELLDLFLVGFFCGFVSALVANATETIDPAL